MLRLNQDNSLSVLATMHVVSAAIYHTLVILVNSIMPAQLEEWFEHRVHTTIQFFNARNVFASEIHYQQVEIYGEGIMSWHSLTK